MRVVSGSARGCRLQPVPGMNTRPTTDRVKENVFNLIQDHVRDADVLDLFAGTGQLGIEQEMPRKETPGHPRGAFAGPHRIAAVISAHRLNPRQRGAELEIGIRAETDRANAACMAALLGGRNIVPPGRSSRGPFSYEQLLLRDPDVIFLVTTGSVAGAREVFRKEFEARPEWKSLRAVKNNRVHFLPPDLFLYLPGSRFPEAFRHLAKLLYPDQEFIE